MAAGPGAFIKQNLTAPGLVGGAIIGATAIAGLAQGESKLKTIATALKDVVLWTASWNLMLSRLFVSFGSGIRSVLAGTGSIEAAMRKLSSMQELQKVFTPLAGGAEAAKVKVAALVNLAASKHLNFESVANAAKNMHILSGGAAGSVEDLNRLASVSKVTGISIGELGNAVGSLSIDSLKNMGAISATAAASLEQLQQNGGSTSQVMNQLASALDAVAASGKGTEDSLAGVEKKYASVVEQMKTAVGSPWIAGDVQNTKNYSDALQALTPALKEVSSAFYIVFGGLATAKSEFVKWVSESGIAQGALKLLAGAIALLVSGLTVLGSVKLFLWLKDGAMAFTGIEAAASRAGLGMQRLTGSMMLANAAAKATTIGMNLLNFAMKAMGFLVLISLVASVYGMIKNWSDGNKEAANEAQGVVDATRQMNQALQEQIDKIDSIVTRQAALRAALKESTDSWAAYYAAVAEGKDPDFIANLKKKAEAADKRAKEAAVHPVGRDQAAIAREDTDAESRTRSEYERAMAFATPEDQKELMAAEGARRSGLGEKGAVEAKKNEVAQKTQADIDVEIDTKKNTATEDEKKRLERIARAKGRTASWMYKTDDSTDSGAAWEGIEGVTPGHTVPRVADEMLIKQLEAQGPIKADLSNLEERRMMAGWETRGGGDISSAESELQQIAYSEDPSRSNIHGIAGGGEYRGMSAEGKLAAKEKYQRQKATATRLQNSYLTDEASGKDLTQQSGQAGKAISMADQIAAVNQRIADSKETGYNLTLQELAAQQEILAIESLKGGLSKADKEGKVEKIKLIQKQIDAASRAHDTEMRQNKASLATSTIRGEGYEVEKEKDKIERKRLVAEEAAAVGPEAQMKAKAALEAHDTMRSGKEVAQFESMDALNDEFHRNRAQARGDSDAVKSLDNFEEFRKNFDARKGVKGLDQARQDAEEMTLNTITLRATNDMNSSNAGVASASMARIGGGGGIGPGATSMIDIAKESRDLLFSADAHLAEIKKKRDGIPAN